MKYEIIKKQELNNNGNILEDVFKIKRKYWLFDSYYHSNIERDLYNYLLIRTFFYSIMASATIVLSVLDKSLIVCFVVNFLSLYIIKKTEKYTCTTFKKIDEAEVVMDNLIKFNGGKEESVKKIELKKDIIYIDKN